MADDHVIAKITADISDLKTELQKGNAEFKAFGEKLDRALPEDPFARARKSLKDFVSVATVSGVFKKVGQAATDFESEIRNLNTITGMGEQQLGDYADNLRTLSLELGTTTGAAANARAAYDLASAGFTNASDNAAVLEATLKAASAGNVEAADAAKLISGSLRAYGASAQEAEKYSDVFFTTVKKGITTFPELTASLGNVTGIAAQAGISIEELGAAVATATSKGIKTTSTVDGLRGAIVNLLAPSKQAKDEMARLGIVVNEQTLKQDGLLKTLQKIREANGGSAESFKRLLGDVQAVSVALALAGDGGNAFADNLKATQEGAGATDAALNEMQKKLQHSIDQLKVALEAAGVAAGSVFLPVAKTVVDTITHMVTGFAKAPPVLRDFATGLAAVGGALFLVSKGSRLYLGDSARATIATALNTDVTWANFKATGANALAKGRAAIASRGFASALNLSTIALGSVVIAGIAAAAAIIHMASEIKKAHAAMDAYTKEASGYAAKIDDAFKSAGKSVEDLAKAGKSSKDLNNELRALKEGEEAVRDSFNKGNLSAENRDAQLKKLSKTYVELREKRNKLAELEKSDAAKRKDPVAPATDSEDKKAAKEAEKARKEALKEALHDIEVKRKAQEISADEEQKLLKEVLKTHQTTGDERRSIEEKIAQITGDKAKEAAEAQKKSAKEAADAKKKAAEEARDATERGFDLQKQSLDIELEAAKTAEDRLRIQKEIVDLEAKKAQFAEKNAKNDAQIATNAAAEKKRLEDESAKEQGKKDANLAEQRGELARAQYDEERAQEENAFSRRRQHLDYEASQGKNVSEERRRLQDEETKAAEAAVAKRLALTEAEIAAKQKAADANAETPEEKALNAQRAALELDKARREAANEKQSIADKDLDALTKQTEELKKQLDLLKQQNDEKNKGDFTLGGTSGIEGLTQNTGSWGVSRARTKGGQSQQQLEGQIARNEALIRSKVADQQTAGDKRTASAGNDGAGSDGGGSSSSFGGKTNWATRGGQGAGNAPSPGTDGAITANLLVELATMLDSTIKQGNAQLLQALGLTKNGGDTKGASSGTSGPVNAVQTPFKYTTSAE